MSKFWSYLSFLALAGVLFGAANAGAEAIIVESYAYDGVGAGAGPHSSFPDTGGVELTDGILPATMDFQDPAWVGYRDNGKTGTIPHPQVTFALGGFWDVGKIEITYLTNAPYTIGAPESVLISLSGDGVEFSDPIPFSEEFGDNSTIGMRTATLDVLGLDDAKFYRLDFRNPYSFTFLSEIAFNGFRSASTTWDGGKGDWSELKWRGGRSAIEHDSIAIDADTGDSDVTLNDVWYASAVSIGLYNSAKFTVGEGGGYLIVQDTISVGADGELRVDANGVLAAKSLHTDGTTVIDADLEDILTLKVNAGSTSLAGGSVVNLDIADGTLGASGHLMVLQNMTVRGGATSLTGGNVANLHVSAGSLTTAADMTVATMLVDAGAVGTDNAAVKILDNANLLGTTFTAGADKPTLTLSGADLLNGRRLMSVADGTVTIGGAMDIAKTDMAAAGDAILTLNTAAAVTIGDMTLDGSTDTTLTISAGPGKMTMGNLTGRGDLRRDGDVGEFLVEGTVAPGNSTGRLGIGGSITIGSLMEIELGGTGEGLFDQLDVTGAAMIDGASLDVSILPSYSPKNGDEFIILSADQGITGQFAPPTLPSYMSIQYAANTVSLHVAVVPEPSTLMLAAIAGLVGLVGLGRRRKTRV